MSRIAALEGEINMARAQPEMTGDKEVAAEQRGREAEVISLEEEKKDSRETRKKSQLK